MTATGGSMSGQVTPGEGDYMTGDRGAETEAPLVVVWKYLLDHGVTTLVLPVGSVVRHVACQPDSGELPVIWIERRAFPDPLPTTVRQFTFVGTGHTFPSGYEHLGTAQSPAGLVWHVYEVPQRGGFSDG